MQDNDGFCTSLGPADGMDTPSRMLMGDVTQLNFSKTVYFQHPAPIEWRRQNICDSL
ncbi:hypothetical protein [Roseovarius pacificus]|uniref:hypothetical protein n=1 Tax=Roseovarius pacificus TaxID=337701 RepID=UPI001356433C|nr:hypothetical protein [Roseovarius pacificus]GGO58336.1 hypothetical protein GCM10011315_27660 [Roseovarius pacificus]